MAKAKSKKEHTKLPKGYDSRFEHPDGTPTTKDERRLFEKTGKFSPRKEAE